MALEVRSPVHWLIASNVTWLLAGLLAYFTPVSIAIGTAIALVPAYAALQALRVADDPWADRAFSFAVGTWAVMAMMTLIPYVATDNGVSLWANHAFVVAGMVLGGLGMLAWNVAVWRHLGGAGNQWALMGVHLALLVGGWMIAMGETMTSPLMLRGDVIDAIDLRRAPLIVAAAGLFWAVVLQRALPPQTN